MSEIIAKNIPKLEKIWNSDSGSSKTSSRLKFKRFSVSACTGKTVFSPYFWKRQTSIGKKKNSTFLHVEKSRRNESQQHRPYERTPWSITNKMWKNWNPFLLRSGTRQDFLLLSLLLNIVLETLVRSTRDEKK